MDNNRVTCINTIIVVLNKETVTFKIRSNSVRKSCFRFAWLYLQYGDEHA